MSGNVEKLPVVKAQNRETGHVLEWTERRQIVEGKKEGKEANGRSMTSLPNRRKVSASPIVTPMGHNAIRRIHEV